MNTSLHNRRRFLGRMGAASLLPAAASEPLWAGLTKGFEDVTTRRFRKHIGAADQGLQPARIGAGCGEAEFGIYRRETAPDGRDVLGEDPGVPIDASVGVVRIDDLEGQALATWFTYGCHAVTMGPRSTVISSDFPGPARELVEAVQQGNPPLDAVIQAIRINDIVLAGRGGSRLGYRRRPGSADVPRQIWGVPADPGHHRSTGPV